MLLTIAIMSCYCWIIKSQQIYETFINLNLSLVKQILSALKNIYELWKIDSLLNVSGATGQQSFQQWLFLSTTHVQCRMKIIKTHNILCSTIINWIDLLTIWYVVHHFIINWLSKMLFQLTKHKNYVLKLNYITLKKG